MPFFEFPPGLAEAHTVGIIYDETDGMNFYPEYGMLRDLFGNPALAADKRYATRCAATLGDDRAVPLRRLAADHPVQPTRCSGGSCAGGTSPGPNTARR